LSPPGSGRRARSAANAARQSSTGSAARDNQLWNTMSVVQFDPEDEIFMIE